MTDINISNISEGICEYECNLNECSYSECPLYDEELIERPAESPTESIASLEMELKWGTER